MQSQAPSMVVLRSGVSFEIVSDLGLALTAEDAESAELRLFLWAFGVLCG